MTLSMREACPECRSPLFKKNGHIHNGKQNHQCKACGCQFIQDATPRRIGAEQRTVVERLLCEKISLHAICRAIGVSIRWLIDFMVARFAVVPADLHLHLIGSSRDAFIGCLEDEADEVWSFLQKMANPHWVGIAMDRQTRQILAFYVGDRSRDSAKQLWTNSPAVYRENALFSADYYAVYLGVIPPAHHTSITQYARKTNHIERFNNTLQQRISRLVRSTLAVSKKVDDHIGAIHYFICHYNLTRTASLV